MIVDASKEELQKVIQHLAYVCRHYTQSISELANVNKITYPLPDGVRSFGFISSCNYDELIYKFTKLYAAIRAKTGYGNGHVKFLDIGCGIGNIMLLAQMFEYAADGLEYNLKTYKAAKQFCAHTPAKILRGDMRTFDRYGDYDVLYYYQPMCDYAVMAEFTRELAKNVKPGAHVVCHGNAEGFRESKEFRLTGSSMWRKRGKLT